MNLDHTLLEGRHPIRSPPNQCPTPLLPRAKHQRRGGRQASTLPFVRRHGEHGGTDDAEGEETAKSVKLLTMW